MIDMIKLVLATVLSLFRKRARLEAENVVLRHQLNILRCSAPRRVPLTDVDRLSLPKIGFGYLIALFGRIM